MVILNFKNFRVPEGSRLQNLMFSVLRKQSILWFFEFESFRLVLPNFTFSQLTMNAWLLLQKYGEKSTELAACKEIGLRILKLFFCEIPFFFKLRNLKGRWEGARGIALGSWAQMLLIFCCILTNCHALVSVATRLVNIGLTCCSRGLANYSLLWFQGRGVVIGFYVYFPQRLLSSSSWRRLNVIIVVPVQRTIISP